VSIVIAALACALWGGVWLALSHLERTTLQDASVMRRNLARSLAEREASSVRAIDAALVSLRNAWLRDPAGFGDYVQLNEELLHREMVIQIAVLDRDGWIRYSRLPQSGPMNFADRDYFQEQRGASGDGLHVSTPVFGRVTRQWALQFTRPVRARNGTFDGLVVVAVPPPSLERLYNDIDLGEGGIVTLARRDGRILARSVDFEKSVGSTVPMTLAAMQHVEAGELLGRGKVDGIERLITFHDLPDYPLRLYVGQRRDTVLAPFERQRLYLVALAGAATLLMLGIALVLALRARERERYLEARERMMLELHDGCIQSVYAIGLNLQESRALATRDRAAADRAIAQAQADLNLVIQDLRAFMDGEVSGPVSPEDFVEEVRRSAPAARAPSLSVDIDQALVGTLAPEQAGHLLRIVREAVSNVVRHAGAAACRISLARVDGETLRLEVSDDGKGLPAGAPRAGSLGLAHIHARAKRMGGGATIVSKPEGGTTVTVWFPAQS